jgi:hypothetical protein
MQPTPALNTDPSVRVIKSTGYQKPRKESISSTHSVRVFKARRCYGSVTEVDF